MVSKASGGQRELVGLVTSARETHFGVYLTGFVIHAGLNGDFYLLGKDCSSTFAAKCDLRSYSSRLRCTYGLKGFPTPVRIQQSSEV